MSALTKARRDGIFDVSLELMLGRLQLQAGQLTEAIASLRRVVDDQPGYPEAAMLLAAAQSGAGDDAAATQTLEAAVQVNPSFFRGQMRLAELYADAHRYQEAADAYAAAQSALGGRADLTPQRASALLNAGKPAAARDLVQKSLADKPDGRDAALLYLLGQAQRQLKDMAAATVTARKLTTAFPDDERGLYLHAQLLADAGQSDEALTAYRDLIKRAPDNPSIVYEYADLLEKTDGPTRPNARFATCSRRIRSMPTRSTRSAISSPNAVSGSTKRLTSCSAR